jgi:hypothetical protein
MQATLDGETVTLPVVLPSVVGMRRALSAVTPASLSGRTYDFLDWSDQGGVAQDIEVPATNLTLTVTYVTPTILVSTNSDWHYLVTSVAPSNSWAKAGFDDSHWPSGPAPLGYGVPALGTLIGFGGDPTNRNLTTYFRHAFTIADPTVFGALLVRLNRADGAIVYLNGTEVFRSNMGGGILSAATDAWKPAPPPAGAIPFFGTNIPPALLAAGTNIIAVEVHKNLPNTPYLDFDLELRATEPQPRLRIQRAGPDVQLYWPQPSTGYLLQSALRFGFSNLWSSTSASISTNGGENFVTMPMANQTEYFRLEKP